MMFLFADGLWILAEKKSPINASLHPLIRMMGKIRRRYRFAQKRVLSTIGVLMKAI